jgi:hypothetical protein
MQTQRETVRKKYEEQSSEIRNKVCLDITEKRKISCLY